MAVTYDDPNREAVGLGPIWERSASTEEPTPEPTPEEPTPEPEAPAEAPPEEPPA